MRKTSSLFVALVAALVMAVPASAVQFGAPDGNNHPQVGMALFFYESGAAPQRCTGTLLSATVFLTAGHCTSGSFHARVWFSPGPITDPASFSSTGTPHTHSGFNNFATFPASFDLGVVVLDTPQPGPYASLAAEGHLDGVKNGARTMFDLVGYGIQDALPPVFSIERTRYAGQAQLVNTKGALSAGYNILLSAAPGTGGALCHGDSGGPVFLAGTTTIVAVNSLVHSTHCMGNALSYRTDTADSLDFIEPFLP
jgi:Trypsin